MNLKNFDIFLHSNATSPQLLLLNQQSDENHIELVIYKKFLTTNITLTHFNMGEHNRQYQLPSLFKFLSYAITNK